MLIAENVCVKNTQEQHDDSLRGYVSKNTLSFSFVFRFDVQAKGWIGVLVSPNIVLEFYK